uniref:Uncharacterized protein n=1 Tax=Anguilla anguilla TaxID=7936 RepID=A0A0E9U6E0_ANGAN
MGLGEGNQDAFPRITSIHIQINNGEGHSDIPMGAGKFPEKTKVILPSYNKNS